MSSKVQTAIRLNSDLLEALKEKAKADNRSLNNYIENLLYQDVENIPNDATKAAVEEARSGNLERIESLDDWLEKL
ncbi:hypothetical protein LB456_06740 [Psychroflexus sp. CAK57W]|uniref:hypothetical protein n=1 Tax=Psychroflexus curvus TaxID=2873595 RepID=UPI001CCD583E|nr:hypothetical protein [Psychroflexus curvus]MBZ9627150.1 hypothetical protein [Psychroflexus curvus]MBZ9787154.1 hypothetical protein [Psychroflexus curvus]